MSMVVAKIEQLHLVIGKPLELINQSLITSTRTKCLGVKKALVFHKGVKTSWMVHEYKLLDHFNLSHRLRGSMTVSLML